MACQIVCRAKNHTPSQKQVLETNLKTWLRSKELRDKEARKQEQQRQLDHIDSVVRKARKNANKKLKNLPAEDNLRHFVFQSIFEQV